jgi:hypothetical protein
MIVANIVLFRHNHITSRNYPKEYGILVAVFAKKIYIDISPVSLSVVSVFLGDLNASLAHIIQFL